MPEIMTPEQVAEYLQLTTDTVYRLIRQKRLAATRIGRHYRIPKEDLAHFLAANSSRREVRAARFREVLAIGERHPEGCSDDLLEELDQEDRERRAARVARR